MLCEVIFVLGGLDYKLLLYLGLPFLLRKRILNFSRKFPCTFINVFVVIIEPSVIINNNQVISFVSLFCILASLPTAILSSHGLFIIGNMICLKVAVKSYKEFNLAMKQKCLTSAQFQIILSLYEYEIIAGKFFCFGASFCYTGMKGKFIISHRIYRIFYASKLTRSIQNVSHFL